MADLTPSPSVSAAASCSLFEKPLALTAASSSSPPSSYGGGVVDDGFEDGCSICLESFTVQDPATVTSCRHEYHLQCILEWSQRSTECPICWQSFVLKDLTSQELLDAVRIERRYRSRNNSPAVPIDHLHFHNDFGADEDASHSDDSDFDECILQHIAAAAAASRGHYIRRRGRQRSAGIGPSRVIFFTSPDHLMNTQQAHQTSPDEGQNFSYGLIQNDSLASIAPSTNIDPAPVASSVDVMPTVVVNGDKVIKPRQPQQDTPSRPSSSEIFSFSESIKSKWSIASARYKESISKGTRGLKEKLLARNNSVKELSKGVQREMSAGIAGVAKIIERLETATKRPGASVPVSSGNFGSSNILFKGKGVQENVTAQSLNNNSVDFIHGLNSETPSSYATGTIANKVEVSPTQGGQ